MSVSRVISAVVFDWAGTVIDYGCRAPAHVFREIFTRREIHVTEAQAREPMGAAKRDHIAAILQMAPVSQQWESKFGALPNDQDVDSLYADFLPLQKQVLAAHTDVIPGAVDVCRWLKEQDVRVASTTGYTRELMEVIIPAAAEQGFLPDSIVCSDEVRVGRPAPWALYEALHRVNAFPVWSCVKVDDTPVGIYAGKNAGAWTVAVTKTGNKMGLSEADLAKLSPQEVEERLEAIRMDFTEMGADYVIDSVNQLPEVLEQIAHRISEGKLPPQ